MFFKGSLETVNDRVTRWVGGGPAPCPPELSLLPGGPDSFQNRGFEHSVFAGPPSIRISVFHSREVIGYGPIQTYEGHLEHEGPDRFGCFMPPE
jgi:hypothetical protein